MSCSREGFNLFNRYGRGCFWSYLKRGKFQPLMWEDTFYQTWCWIVGHKIYNAGEGNGKDQREEWACRRCHQYISQKKGKK